MSEADPDAAILERLSQPPEAQGDALDAAELRRRLGLRSDYLAARLLAQFDDDDDGSVPRTELIAGLEALIAAPPRARLRFAFDVHDHDGDGSISRRELLRMLHISLAENALVFGDEMVEALTDALLLRADADGDGQIDFVEFERALSHHEAVLAHMSLGDLRWLGLGEARDERPRAPLGARIKALVEARGAFALLVCVHLALSLGLFCEAAFRYRESGVFVALARGQGAALNLHGALILLPMCRRMWTTLGRTRIGRLLIDDHVAYHRIVGNAALALGLGHGVAHGLNALFVAPAGLAALATWAGGTGAALLLVHGVIYFFARDAIRRSGRFELFGWTHRLYPLWLLLLLVHGPHAWVWLFAPLALFGIDRFLARRAAPTIATEVEALSQGVTALTIVRPRDLDYQPGDFVYVRVPAIARREWHPFTISSAPERRDALTVHVRSVGNWTRALHELARARTESSPPLEVWVDGAHGTASAHVFESRRALLVAAGIGVTPFASVLASMKHRLETRSDLTLEHVTFVWVAREQRAFEWFTHLLGRLEAAHPALFDVRIFMDAARSDLKSSVLLTAMDCLYATVQADLITGLKSRTTLGAPDWDQLVSDAKAKSPQPLDCFFCGPPGLATIVRAACDRHGVPFRQEHF